MNQSFGVLTDAERLMNQYIQIGVTKTQDYQGIVNSWSTKSSFQFSTNQGNGYACDVSVFVDPSSSRVESYRITRKTDVKLLPIHPRFMVELEQIQNLLCKVVLPEDLKIEKPSKEEIDTLCKRIDSMLLESVGVVTLTIAEKFIPELAAIYTSAGWKIRLVGQDEYTLYSPDRYALYLQLTT